MLLKKIKDFPDYWISFENQQMEKTIADLQRRITLLERSNEVNSVRD
jgi:hypothetical protein